MVEHPDLDPDVTLHLGDPQKSLVEGYVFVFDTKMRRMRTFLAIASRWSSR